MRRAHHVFPALLILVPFWNAGALPPIAPGQFELDPRLVIESWAAEPDVVDPVSICWDESGVAYVAECRDYPYGVGPDGRVGSTVRRLVDTDGDGIPDRATLFARDLSFATSVTPWRGGVLVVAPPDILFLKDTDGDGVANTREVILTGLHRGISDSLANGLRYGLDNRIHVANGGSSGTVTSPRKSEVVTPLGENDFSFGPDTGDVQLTARTGGGFGLVFDEFGRAFTPNNTSHIRHRFLPLSQTGRFPGFPPMELTGSVSDHEEMSRLFPISVAQTRPNHPEQAGHFSAAGGMGFLGSGAFPGDLPESVLVGDVVGNLIHRDVIHPDGPVFRASRGPTEQNREFLASRDPAFRPVGAETGPDGALYVLDMQRDVIEHPDYIPEKLRKTLDVRAGDDRGRIYRITPKQGWRPVRPSLAKASDAERVPWLASDNQWHRLTAQRLLVERGNRAVVPAVRALAREATNAPGRVHALWTLQGLGELKEADVLTALLDPHPGVRENALRLAENFLPAAAALRTAVLQRADDDSARVRFIAAGTLGALGDEAAAAALQRILERDFAFTWSRRAVLSSLAPDQTRKLVGSLLDQTEFTNTTEPTRLDTLRELADLLGARAEITPREISWLLLRIGDLPGPAARTALLDGLANGLERAGFQPSLTAPALSRLSELAASYGSEEMRALWRVTRGLGLPENNAQRAALAGAMETASDSTRTADHRLAAVRLLTLGPAATVTNCLFTLLDAREPIEVQQAALVSLGPFRDPAVGAALVLRWRSVSPALRTGILNLLLDRRTFHDALLEALEDGRIEVGELNLDLEQRRRLLRGGTANIRQRAAKFMGDEEYSNRKALVNDWLARLPAGGDPNRGRVVFLELCARCHISGAVGHRVGPDLTGVSHRSVEDLLSNILDPNMAINPAFVACTVEKRDGEAQTGLMQAESAEAVTLLQAEGKQVVIPRREILRIESNGHSLMPEGLEAGKSSQQLRDLIAFLQQPA